MTPEEERWESRYDGAIRRSQRQHPRWIDRIWNFFSSVKVGVWLIVCTVVATLIGSLYPQQSAFVRPPPVGYYQETYGTLGGWYAQLGFDRTYESWWFLLLVVLLGTSIVIASIDRGIPLYKVLRDQKVVRSRAVMQKQPFFYGYRAENMPLEAIMQAMRTMRYRVRQEGTAILAEKNRWSRAGPYINHVGLVLFLILVMIRSVPALTSDQMVSLVEGERTPIEGTAYYLANERFTLEWYEPGDPGPPVAQGQAVPKRFETIAVLYRCDAACEGDNPVLVEVIRKPIEVNQPLRYQGLEVYQFGYEVTPQIRSVRVYVREKQTGAVHGPITLKTNNPDTTYRAGPYTIRLIHYFPQFAIDEQGKPTTLSANEPLAPAYVFGITGGNAPATGWTYLYFPREIDKVRFDQDELNARTGGGLAIDIAANSMADVDIATYTSTLVVRSDPTLPYLLVAAIICMIGLVIGFYTQHRRIWFRDDEDGQWILAAHSHKNPLALQKEVSRVRAVFETSAGIHLVEQKEG